MSKLIEQLAVKSLVEHGGELIFSKEKFAELIVRECAGISEQHNRNYYKSHGQIIADKIKQHFGVEE